jgi:hypothetical protein
MLSDRRLGAVLGERPLQTSGLHRWPTRRRRPPWKWTGMEADGRKITCQDVAASLMRLVWQALVASSWDERQVEAQLAPRRCTGVHVRPPLSAADFSTRCSSASLMERKRSSDCSIVWVGIWTLDRRGWETMFIERVGRWTEENKEAAAWWPTSLWLLRQFVFKQWGDKEETAVEKMMRPLRHSAGLGKNRK